MLTIPVALGERAYDVRLGPGARHDLAELIARRAPRAQSAAIITSASLRAMPWWDVTTGLAEVVIEVPDGEDAKSFAVLASVTEQLAAQRLSRHDVIVAVGGGALTDLAGFAAAVYLRGVAVVHVSTTVAGQVDAAIGGKTAIDIAAGKNLVGAFHQPLGVLCDLDTLATLPDRDRTAGMAEVAKCWLLEGRDLDFLGDATTEELMTLAIRLKANIVAGDEREGGRRALLNYGHTLGHAVEAVSLARSDDPLRHGEAVAIGLAFAARLARELGRVDDTYVALTDAVVRGFGLDPRLPDGYEADELLALMAGDKKAHHDLTFVLAGPEGIEVVAGVDLAIVRDALVAFGASL